jgi:heat shock protein HtpX
MKRIMLFLATNLAILIVLSIVAQVLGIDRYLHANGGNLGGLLAFAALFGFGGAFISLAISKWMAKRSMGVRVIERPLASPCRKWASSIRPSRMPSPPVHARTLPSLP